MPVARGYPLSGWALLPGKWKRFRVAPFLHFAQAKRTKAALSRRMDGRLYLMRVSRSQSDEGSEFEGVQPAPHRLGFVQMGVETSG